MQTLIKEHKGKTYTLDYLETEGVIFVFVNNKHRYLIKVMKKKYRKKVRLFCNCPAGKYHSSCHHEETSKDFNFHKKKFVKSFINRTNEQYLTEWIRRKNGIKDNYR